MRQEKEVNSEPEKMHKEAVVAYFNMLYQSLPGLNEQITKNLRKISRFHGKDKMSVLRCYSVQSGRK